MPPTKPAALREVVQDALAASRRLVLASHPGEVQNYVTLVKEAPDYQAEEWEAKELIKRHIFTLRKKIDPNTANPCYIHNVRGVGYRFTRLSKNGDPQ
ncbi:MAG: winged helix family transcriptional regulator [Chloroflexi bacterium]|nr:MAG: winged helix family transcriptional regulator [Chloroflexota bacterium]